MLLFGHREAVANYVLSRIRDQEPFLTGYEAIGALDSQGELIGGFVYSEHRLCPGGGSVGICAAGERDWLSRANLSVFLGSYPFGQLGCHRINAMIAKSNKRARGVIERLGFKNEGTIRGAFAPNKDGIFYGLLQSESRWIRK